MNRLETTGKEVAYPVVINQAWCLTLLLLLFYKFTHMHTTKCPMFWEVCRNLKNDKSKTVAILVQVIPAPGIMELSMAFNLVCY